ncbi:MAG TPA: hypothetical protein ENH65_07735 [Candidatus Aminicenantes bacterium]|nr:hypothetical protein [Candidatus Aminicenantes bacterium]
MSRIFGQCSLADIKEMEALAERLDVATFHLLTKNQKLALLILAAFEAAHLERSDAFVLREVLFWDDGHIEMKFLDVPRAKRIYLALQQPLRKEDLAKSFSDILTKKEDAKWYENLSSMAG